MRVVQTTVILPKPETWVIIGIGRTRVAWAPTRGGGGAETTHRGWGVEVRIEGCAVHMVGCV